MITKLNIKKYRKLNNIVIDLDSPINIISGTNGTCKSSILYLVSNAFQELKSTTEWLKSKDVSRNIKALNKGVNLKIESLAKGDDEYNDPATGEKGTLFTCFYEDGTVLDFRRHNTRENQKNRFALKPAYKRGEGDKLPTLPVIYLGLSRLYAFGEYGSEIKAFVPKIPEEYINSIAEIYKDFTGIEMKDPGMQAVGDIKKRAKFDTDVKGIDSNTISAGEDNLAIIITALVSLRYYYDNISSCRETESILLIDEMDATLHPAYQSKLLNLFIEYAEKYRIKFIFTSHSISLLEYALRRKCNVIYLVDNITSVAKMDDVDIYKIKMYLNNLTKDEIYLSNTIPVFTEDAEARDFLNVIFEHFERRKGGEFKGVRTFFHLVEVSISGDSLVSMFSDGKLLRTTMRSICIIDGDKKEKSELSNYTIALPGGASPEQLAFSYAKELYENDDAFWMDSTISDLGYSKVYFRDKILPDINSIEEKIKEKKEKGDSVKGVNRELNKKVYGSHQRFFNFVLKYWVEMHEQVINEFYNDLHILFCKVSEFHDISPKEWKVGSINTNEN